MDITKVAIAHKTTEHGNSGYILYMPYTGNTNRYGWYMDDEFAMNELNNDAEDYGRELIVTEDRAVLKEYGIN